MYLEQKEENEPNDFQDNQQNLFKYPSETRGRSPRSNWLYSLKCKKSRKNNYWQKINYSNVRIQK